MSEPAGSQVCGGMFRLGQNDCRLRPQSLGRSLEASAILRRGRIDIQPTEIDKTTANLMVLGGRSVDRDEKVIATAIR